MKENTVVTIGDMNYLWGIFMLIASMRQNGMDEPVLVGGLNFTDEAIRLLQQFLAHTDLVKYARATPSPQEISQTIADTRAFITETIEDPIPSSSTTTPPPTPSQPPHQP